MRESLEVLKQVEQAPAFMGGNPKYWACTLSKEPYLKDITIIEQDLLRIDELEVKAKAFDVLKDRSCPLIWERNGKYLLVYPFMPTIELTYEQYEILKKAGVE